ncbi:hypothetical protein N9971_00055 [bacterium]|nr:hypothetical protein [bacterium]
MLKLVAMGRQSTERGKTRPADEALEEIVAVLDGRPDLEELLAR